MDFLGDRCSMQIIESKKEAKKDRGTIIQNDTVKLLK